MFEQPDNTQEVHKKRMSLDEINSLILRGSPLEADFVFQLPQFKPDPVIPSTRDWSYYTFREEDGIRRFAEDFLRTIPPGTSSEAVLEGATKYVLEHVQWIGSEDTHDIARIVESRKGACTSKSVLLAYIAHQLGKESFVITGYARNVPIDICTKLKERNSAYKGDSEYPDYLFNLPLEAKDTPIENDVGHAWVGVRTEKGIIYADPTTGLVSTTPEEEKIFAENYKVVPIAHPDFIDGVELTEEQQNRYTDLDFIEPVQKIHTQISAPIPDVWRDGASLVLKGPDDEDVHLRSPLLGFDKVRSLN